MYFNPPQEQSSSFSAKRQNVNRSEEESEKKEDKGKKREIDETQNAFSYKNPFQISAFLQQPIRSYSSSSVSAPASASTSRAITTTFTRSTNRSVFDYSHPKNDQQSTFLKENPFALREPSLDALITVKRLMEKSDVSWKQIYSERQRERMMNSSSTNEDSDPFPNNGLQSNHFPLDPSNLSSDTGESQSIDQSFNGLLPNNLGQYPILHTPLQPGAAALLNMTESLDLSSTSLQPHNSDQAYKPTKMNFSDPFASDRAGKEVQAAAKNAPEKQTQKNAVEMQVEGESTTNSVGTTSKRAYPINEDLTGKRERRAGETGSDIMDAEVEVEANRNDEVAIISSNSSPERGRRASIKGRSNRNTGGNQRKNLRPRVTKPKEIVSTIESTNTLKEKRSSLQEPSSSAVTIEKDVVHPSSETDVNDVESQKAQKAIGDLMRQQQMWQNVVSKLKNWLLVCHLKLSRIGLQLEEAQRDTVEKQKMQLIYEVEQLVRHDMALNMQQANSQLWNQNSMAQGSQSFTSDSAPYIFSQPVYSTQISGGVWPGTVQNAAISMPSSDSTDSTFASQYLEYAPGQFQQIQKSYAGTESGNSGMESMRVNLKHPTESNTSSSLDAASILPQTNQNSQYTFTTEDEKGQPAGKLASPLAIRGSLSYSNTTLVPQQQLTPSASSHPSSSRAQSVPNRTTKMTRPTSSKGTTGPIKDVYFILTDYGSSGDVTWKLDDNEPAQRLASKFYLPNQPPFPVRPLREGVLRRIHDEWLQSHLYSSDMFRSGGHGFSTTYQGAEGARKYFPQVETNSDSAYLRQAWQDLERRRILNLSNFPEVIEDLRKEAIEELKREATQRAMMSATMMNALTWANIATQEPPQNEIDNRARLNWERRKAAAAYAVGLLRQAEYCVAEGFRAFAIGQTAVPEKESNKTSNVVGVNSHPPTVNNQSRHHREKHSHGKKGELPSNVYSATLPHGGTGSGSDAVLASPSILASTGLSPEQQQPQQQVNRNPPPPPERKSSNDSWDATMMRRIGSK